jgi:hypothetical protein
VAACPLEGLVRLLASLESTITADRSSRPNIQAAPGIYEER